MQQIRTNFLCEMCRAQIPEQPEPDPETEPDNAGEVRNQPQINESTHLINQTRRPMSLRRRCIKYCDIFWIVAVFFIFLLGVAIGSYLLATDGDEWRLPGRLDIISRTAWHAHPPSFTMPELRLPVTDVLLVQKQTNSTGCRSSEPACAKLMLKLQSVDMLEWKEPDIMYNFIVTGYGIYEGRGWNFQSSYRTSHYSYNAASTITLAFLGAGNFRETFPTRRQVQSAALFHEYALMEGYLAPCYRILVWGESRELVDIAYNIQQQVKPQCEGLLLKD